jgi:hypothetical protein
LCETLVSGAEYLFRVPQDYLITNGPGLFVFDPDIGYRLGSEPVRLAWIHRGVVTGDAVVRGNGQGFADRRGFESAGREGVRRIAVFGDSFTAGIMLDASWPTRTEEASGVRGDSVRLLNLAQDGTGLANWWSVMFRVVEPRTYELDAVVFAVWGDDLRRPFTMADQAGDTIFWGNDGWAPDSFPRSRGAARAFLRPNKSAFVVDSTTYEAALQGTWHPRPLFRLVIWSRVQGTVSTLLGRLTSEEKPPGPVLHAGQRRLIEDLRLSLDLHRLPRMVVRLPKLDELLHHKADSRSEMEARSFAARMGAVYVDGAAAFEGLDSTTIRGSWNRFDAHWADGGSDRFARFMDLTLQSWIRDIDVASRNGTPASVRRPAPAAPATLPEPRR